MPNFQRDKDYFNYRKDITILMLIIFAISLSVIEAFFPLYFVVPGLKLGLSNLVITSMYGVYGYRDIFYVSFFKALITTFIIGTISIFIFSLAGLILAFAMMTLCHFLLNDKISLYTLAVIGAVAHNTGQVLFAIIYLNVPEFINYLPYALIFSTIFGMIIGHLAIGFQKYLIKVKHA